MPWQRCLRQPSGRCEPCSRSLQLTTWQTILWLWCVELRLRYAVARLRAPETCYAWYAAGGSESNDLARIGATTSRAKCCSFLACLPALNCIILWLHCCKCVNVEPVSPDAQIASLRHRCGSCEKLRKRIRELFLAQRGMSWFTWTAKEPTSDGAARRGDSGRHRDNRRRCSGAATAGLQRPAGAVTKSAGVARGAPNPENLL